MNRSVPKFRRTFKIQYVYSAIQSERAHRLGFFVTYLLTLLFMVVRQMQMAIVVTSFVLTVCYSCKSPVESVSAARW